MEMLDQNSQKILMIEDNEVIRLLVQTALKDFNFLAASNLKEAESLMFAHQFDLILLDIGLPDGDGLNFLNQLSQANKDQPAVIILSGQSDISSKVAAFSFGAEDFITKPFDPIELKARVAAKLKKIVHIKGAKNSSDLLIIGDLEVNIPKQKVCIRVSADQQIPADLTSLELKLLLTLAKKTNHVCTREYLLSEVWGDDLTVTVRSVDTHVAHLRKKIHKSKVKIDTVIRSGYRLLTNS